MQQYNHDDRTRTHILLTEGTLVGHYRIIEKIGAGGMGEVYLAEDTKLKRRVALKLLPSQYASDRDFKSRFIREAEPRLEAKLKRRQDRSQFDPLWYRYASGCIAFYKGDLEAASRHLESAADKALPVRDVSGSFYWIHLMLARTYLESRKYDAAVREFEGLMLPQSEKGVFWAGLSMWRSGDAITCVVTRYYLGQAYEQSGRADKAIEQYEAFLDIWKDADPGIESIEDGAAGTAEKQIVRLI